MMRDRHAQRLILVPSSKFVGYGSVDEDDEAEGLEAPYINKLKWVDYATLEASRTPEIARYVENDNLADIKLKLTCTNSIVAMNIYMEQMKYHRAKGNGLLVEDEEEFLQPYIDSVESIRSTRAYNAMDGWIVTRGVK